MIYFDAYVFKNNIHKENEYRRFSDGTYLFPSFKILILVLKLIIVYFNN